MDDIEITIVVTMDYNHFKDNNNDKLIMDLNLNLNLVDYILFLI